MREVFNFVLAMFDRSSNFGSQNSNLLSWRTCSLPQNTLIFNPYERFLFLLDILSYLPNYSLEQQAQRQPQTELMSILTALYTSLIRQIAPLYRLIVWAQRSKHISSSIGTTPLMIATLPVFLLYSQIPEHCLTKEHRDLGHLESHESPVNQKGVIARR